MKGDTIIYRKKSSDIFKVFDEIVKCLEDLQSNSDRDRLTVDKNLILLYVDGYTINFFCGPVWKMGGIRPSLYNTDCKHASDFLEQGAEKVNGKEVKDLNELLKMVWEE